MDDITKTQQSFAIKALHNPEHRFADLYHLICRDDWIGLDSIRWTFLKSRAEPEENVHDASASKAHLYPGMQSTDR